MSTYLGHLAFGNFKEDGKLSGSNYKCHYPCVTHNKPNRMRVVPLVTHELGLEPLRVE